MNVQLKIASKKNIQIEIKYIILILILFFGLSGLTTAYFTYTVSKKSTTDFVENRFSTFFEDFTDFTYNYFNSGKRYLNSYSETLQKFDFIKNFDEATFKELLKSSIKNFPNLTSAYFADTTGNFYLIKPMPDNSYSFRKIIRTDRDVKTLWEHETDDYYTVFKNSTDTLENGYDPRKRMWYSEARKQDKLIVTKPYVFASDRLPGMTMAKPVYVDLNNTGVREFAGVLAVDFGFKDVSRKLGKIGDVKKNNSYQFMLDDEDNILGLAGTGKTLYGVQQESAYSEPKLYKISELDDPVLQSLRLENAPSYHMTEGVLDAFFLHFFNWLQSLFFDDISSVSLDSKNIDLKLAKFDNKNYLFAVKKINPLDELNFHYKLGIVIPEEVVLGDANLTLKIASAVSLLITLLVMLCGIILSYAITRPLSNLSSQMHKIRTHFDIKPSAYYRLYLKEISSLRDAFENMKQGLQSFKKYVPAKLVSDMIRHGVEARVGGEKKEVTVFFSDIEGFTGFSEKTDPQELMNIMSDYFGRITDVIISNNGTLDKFIGDATMAFWGAPDPMEDHAWRACLTAILCRDAINQFNAENSTPDFSGFRTRIGINTGEAVVGNLGSEERLNYTAIGDQVNLASRLEGLNKFFETTVIISESTYNRVQDKVDARMLDKVTVRGRSTILKVYELISFKGQSKPEEKELTAAYHGAMALYFNQQWMEAIELFKACLKINCNDSPSQIMIERCNFLINNPPENWEGIYREIR